MKYLAKNERHDARLNKNLTKAEKRKFYLQEFFEGQDYVKKYLFILLAVMIIGQILVTIFKTQSHDLDQTGMIPLTICLSLTCVCFLGSMISGFRQKGYKSLTIQYVLLILANLLGFASAVIRVQMFKMAVEKMTLDGFLDGLSLTASALYITRFSDVVNPFWHLKIIIPLGYYVGLSIAAIQKLSVVSVSVLINCIGGLIVVVVIHWINFQFRWKIFESKIDNENWNDIHKLILEKVPTAIAVFNNQGKLKYSNPVYKKLDFDDERSFLQRLESLKRRNERNSAENTFTMDEGFKSDEGGQGKLKFIATGKTEREEMIDGELYEDFANLSQLLEASQDLLNKGRIKEDSYFVYDGKFSDHTYKRTQSYEVTLTFALEKQDIILIIKNTTEHNRILTLESINEYKDKLLASVSHELRTPLNGNLSLIEAAINHPDTSENIKEQYLVPAHRSGKLLLHLINDILDYSQIAAKKLRLNFERLSIKDTVRSCHQLLELQAKMKNIDFKCILDDKLSFFTTDHDRIRQVILNLLSNALKFTYKGSVTLTARALNVRDVEITVQDTGSGMRDEDVKKLFQEFTRFDNPDQLKFNARGVGLGLSIANKLVTLLGRKSRPEGIKVKSVPEKGSIFTFIIQDQETRKSSYNEDHLDVSPFDTNDPINQRREGFIMSRNQSFETISPTNIERIKNISMTHFISRELNQIAELNSSLNSTKDQRHSSTLNRGSQKKTLVVDDDPFNILALQSYLKSWNVSVESAFNGKEAVDKVIEASNTDAPFDVVFMDCQMPIMTGYEATRALQELISTNEIKTVPIIACTAFNDEQPIKQCFEAGMCEVLKKPLSRAQFDEVAKVYLNRKTF